MDSNRVPSAMSENEIMRNHVFYQKSYIEDLVTPRRQMALKYYSVRTTQSKTKVIPHSHSLRSIKRPFNVTNVTLSTFKTRRERKHVTKILSNVVMQA